MSNLKQYLTWCNAKLDDMDLVQELAAIKGDDEAIADRFYRTLEFGTAGIRGVIGAGTNRMNIYTVRQATQGLANYLNQTSESPAVAIGYDSRIKSDLFAKEAARVLAANGVKVYLYPQLMPVPCVSFAVRHLHCQAGIMITASHNPAKYNGYKCYGADGCQMTAQSAAAVTACIAKVDILRGAKVVNFEDAVLDGAVEYISREVVDAYLQQVLAQAVFADACKDSNLSVVYTPLNGAGNKPVREVLAMRGMQHVAIVDEQENPDGLFPTCPFPNPEIKQALDLGLQKAQAIGADLLLATDPDCDRVGIAVKDAQGGYKLLSGNEVGILLFDYICMGRKQQNTMPKDPIVVKTIVTTAMINAIAAQNGVRCIDVLTGFKYIGEQIAILEQAGHPENYLFGFEESYGYLCGTYVRDKDAVVASMLICEMAAYYQTQGIGLLEKLQSLYAQYGVYYHTQKSFMLEGATGMEKMAQIMEFTRQNPPAQIAGRKVLTVADYKRSVCTDTQTGAQTVIDLPKSDVLSFGLAGQAQVILRPSGTEPKIKVYYTAIATDNQSAATLEEQLDADFTAYLGL